MDQHAEASSVRAFELTSWSCSTSHPRRAMYFQAASPAGWPAEFPHHSDYGIQDGICVQWGAGGETEKGIASAMQLEVLGS